MYKNISVQCFRGLRMLLVIIGMATSLTAQDQWPAAITPHKHEDTLFAATPTHFIRGWNWGMPVRHTSNAMQTNMEHYAFDQMLVTADSTALTTEGHDLLNASPDVSSAPGPTLYMIPQFRFPFNIMLPNVNPVNPITNFKLFSDGFNSPDVAIGFRYEPEMDAHDTTDAFTPEAAASPGAAFGFRTRSSADGNAGHRRLIQAANHSAPETVLSNVWPQDQLHSWWNGTSGAGSNDLENTRRMLLVVNLRRADGTPDDNSGNQNETVLTLRLPYKLGHNGTPANNIRFSIVADGTSTTRQLNTVDATYGLTLGPAAPTSDDREFRITRRMIPSATAGTRDINLVASFLCDDDIDHNPRVKTGKGTHVESADLTSITSMDIEVEYNPTIDVAIDFIGIRTPQAHQWLCGWYQEAMRVAHDTALYSLRKFDSLTSRHYKIHRIYGRDEAELQFWEGLRHYNLSESHRVITEVGIEWPKRFKHHTEIDRLWQGNTAKFGVNTYTPAIWHGNTNAVAAPNDYPWHGYASGYEVLLGGGTKVWNVAPYTTSVGWFRADYDVWASDSSTSDVPPRFSCDLPLRTAVLDSVVGKLDGLSLNGNNSPLAALETTLTHQRFHGSYLFDSTMWYSNIWTDVKVKKLAASSRFMWGGDARPKTSEEVRMQMWNQVVLGTKGLVVFYGPSELRRRVLQTYTENRDFQLGLTYSMEANQFNAAGAMATPQSTYTNASNELGYDFIPTTTADDSLGLSNLLLNATLTHDPAFFTSSQGVATNRLYLGLKSTRMEAARIMTQIQSVEDSLIHLHMMAWKAVGFRSWVAGDSTLMAGYMSLDTAHQFVRPINRVDAQGYPAKEDNDSMFYDITLHSKDGLGVDSIFYVGVLNRRTNPRVRSVYPVTTSYPRDSILFFTGEEWRDSVRKGTWNRLSQLGSRLIRIPFNYTRKTDAAYNLRVKEVSWDTSVYSGPMIDTTVGSDVALEIAFQPGEGKFFRVEAVRASGATEARGFLDHSNQRKIVAYPKAVRIDTITDPNGGRKYLRTTYADTVRYHMVYHRRTTPGTTTETGPVSVYYRRSAPVHMSKDTITGAQSAFDASVLQWEDEILISDALRDLVTTETPTDRGQLSCAYPSLVVRTDSVAGSPKTMQSRVYIVYGCEYRENSTAPWQMFISEAVMPADSSRTVQAAYHTGFPPNVIASTLTPSTTRLENWGTPMINASATGNFYCWPNSNSGIEFGFKLPDQTWFVATQKGTVRGRTTTAATHPSLNTYSRLYLGEEDAALVWQEGDTISPGLGKYIFYTRLFHAATYPHAPRFDLNAGGAGNRQNVTTIPFVDGIADPNNRIALLTDTSAVFGEDTVRAKHAYPVVYRHLSDWEAVSTDSLYDLRPVNNKADRIYWQTQRYYPTAGKWRITRRPVDIHEWYVMNGTADKIWTMAPHYIFDQSNHLMGPDVAQGTQWGDPSSNPMNPAPWYADSSVILNFWSESSTSSATPNLWHMQYGWNYYGQNVDHDRADLVSAGWMKSLHENGRYPHLAARHSYTQAKEWMRNRRIFEAVGATRSNFDWSPNIMQSSQYFYKEEADATQPMAIRYGGFRGGNNTALLGPIMRIESGEMIPMTGEDQGPNERADQRKLVSSWMEVPAVSDVSMLSMTQGTEQTASLYVERESTGELLEVEPSQTTQVGVVVPNAQNGASQPQSISRYTLLGSENERYRFVLLAQRGDVFQVEDIQLIQPDDAEAFSKQRLTRTAESSKILDLRSMKKSATIMGQDVVVYPNPATNHVRIVVNIRANETPSKLAPTTASVVITDERGGEMHRSKCNVVDALTIDTATWTTGIYNVRVMTQQTNGQQCVKTQQFVVVR